MSPLEKHIYLMSGYAQFEAQQSDLAPLMIANTAPGQRALVYRNSGMLALVGALRSNYPRLDALMGEAFFSDMAKAYVQRHPAKQRSLVSYGDQLADFIDVQVDDHKLEWLGDLARLDRGWLEAHLAADATPLPIDRLVDIPQETLLTSLVVFHPSLRLIQTRWDIGPLWLGLKAGVLPDTQQTLGDTPSSMMFWRPAGEVLAKSLSPEESLFLEILRRGVTLTEACSHLLDANPDANLSILIAGVISADLITDLRFEEADPDENS